MVWRWRSTVWSEPGLTSSAWSSMTAKPRSDMASTTLPTLSSPEAGVAGRPREASSSLSRLPGGAVRSGRVRRMALGTPRSRHAMVAAILGVVFLLLTSTMDAVWLDRGSFSGSSERSTRLRRSSSPPGAWPWPWRCWLLMHVGPGTMDDSEIKGSCSSWHRLLHVCAAVTVRLFLPTAALGDPGDLSFFGDPVLCRRPRTLRDGAGPCFELFWDGLYHVMGAFVSLVFLASLALDAAGMQDSGGAAFLSLRAERSGIARRDWPSSGRTSGWRGGGGPRVPWPILTLSGHLPGPGPFSGARC